MARSFKICFDDEIFVVNSGDYGSLIEEIYTRKPDSRNRPLKCYYEGEL